MLLSGLKSQYGWVSVVVMYKVWDKTCEYIYSLVSFDGWISGSVNVSMSLFQSLLCGKGLYEASVINLERSEWAPLFLPFVPSKLEPNGTPLACITVHNCRLEKKKKCPGGYWSFVNLGIHGDLVAVTCLREYGHLCHPTMERKLSSRQSKENNYGKVDIGQRICCILWQTVGINTTHWISKSL